MTRLAETEAHIGSMTELLSVVGAMRSLAGMRMQEAQQALPGIRRYAIAMATAIADTLLLMPDFRPTLPARTSPQALILCAAEHGFVGGFNEHLVDAALAQRGNDDLFFVLGTRGSMLALEKGAAADWSHPMASRSSGVPEMVNRLAVELYRRIARGEIGRISVLFARYRQGTASALERHVLLPLDAETVKPDEIRQPPLHNLAPAALYEKLVAEYVFARLTEAAVESLASENAARFAAMESAHDNVARKLEDLRRQARLARQAEITTELIELATGAEALVQH